MCHCTPAWATEQDLLSKTNTEKPHTALGADKSRGKLLKCVARRGRSEEAALELNDDQGKAFWAEGTEGQWP